MPATRVIAFAHRGSRLEYPDNTLPGFARALQLGATGLECDAWMTADGVAVLDHDGVVRRGLRRVPISECRRDDLPAHIPDMEALWSLAGADFAEVSVDVKDGAAVGAVVAAAGTHLERLWLCSPDLRALTAWRTMTSGPHLVHSTGVDHLEQSPGAHARRLRDVGVAALNLRAVQWSQELVDACHEAGIAAFAWDAQRRSTLETLVRMGLDAVYSDHVARMVDVLSDAGVLHR